MADETQQERDLRRLLDRTDDRWHLLPPERFERLGDHVIFVPVCVTRFDDHADGPAVEAVFDVVDGELICHRLTLVATERGVQGKDLRAVSVDELRETVAAHWSTPAQVLDSDGHGVTNFATSWNTDDARAGVQNLRATRRRRSDEHSRKVAEVYLSAERAPTAAVADAFGVAHRTAGMYVRAARDKGLIPAVKRSGQIERRDQ
ncbi:MAG: hypothetical protein H0U51_06190 [Propionibacteriales bacterium]|nr:hypothetical protein [Propionibacteriales bacterium]